jgi:multisubunit Na+/H+ antiporter MnhG subunit
MEMVMRTAIGAFFVLLGVYGLLRPSNLAVRLAAASGRATPILPMWIRIMAIFAIYGGGTLILPDVFPALPHFDIYCGKATACGH